jgi:hypothetical protein
MSALAQLKRLRSLQLFRTGLGALDEQQLQAFSALTASSQLSSLIAYGQGPQPLPRGAVRHMLPPGRVLQALKVLRVECCDNTDAADSFDADAWCVDAADIDSISAACPNLQTLKLCCVVRATPEVVSSLGRLQRLPLLELSVGDSTGWLTDDAADALAGISSLRRLRVYNARQLSDVGLEHLTALRQLRRLSIRNAGLSADVAPRHDNEHPWLESQYDSAPGELELITFNEVRLRLACCTSG